MRLPFPCVVLVLMSFVFVGCNPETISWSPDGRYLAFVGDQDGKLLLWDSQTLSSKILSSEKVVCCKYLPGDLGILYGFQTKEDQVRLHRIDLKGGNESDFGVETSSLNFDVSKDGQTLYYLKTFEATESTEFWVYDLSGSVEAKKLFVDIRSHTFPRIDPTKTRILSYTMNDKAKGLSVFNLVNSTSKDLTPTFSLATQEQMTQKRTISSPVWLDENQVLYYQAIGEEGPGDLCLYSFTKDATEVLCQDVFCFDPIGLRPDGKAVAVALKEKFETRVDVYQLYLFDLESRQLKPLTKEPFGVSSPCFDPQGKRIAYRNIASTVRVLDLETSRKTYVCSTEEERLLWTADTLFDAGDFPQAGYAYQDLLKKVPDTRFKDYVWYKTLLLNVQSPNPDLDEAFQSVKNALLPDAMPNIRPFLWRDKDLLASDPPEDWIASYRTEASSAEYGFNTDLTRDLLGFSARWSPTRLYLKIDYSSSKDLHGLTFQDTVFLFDNDSPEEGIRAISPSVQWDRGAERQVFFRCWSDDSGDSQYDVEIIRGNQTLPESMSKFLGNGFAGGQYPDLDIVDIVTDKQNSVLFSISREALGLLGKRKSCVQLCTFKGGLESLKQKEAPRVSFNGDKPTCDVADCFGEQNTRERMEKDLAEGAPLVILGYAACLEMNE